MSNKAAKTVGVILSSTAANFRDTLLDGLSRAFYQKGVSLIFGLTGNSVSREQDCIRRFSEITDCIVIISCAKHYSEIAPAISGQVPMLFLINKPEGCPYTCILENDYSAIYQAVLSHFNLKKGNVGCICDKRGLSSTEELLRAYRDAVLTSSMPFSEDLIYDIHNNAAFDVHKVILDLKEKGCTAILAATPAITSRILDDLVFYNTNPLNEPLHLFGYGAVGSALSSQMNIDVILHPVNQLIDITTQQCIYMMNHPEYNNFRDFLIKGTLSMHTYDGLHAYHG